MGHETTLSRACFGDVDLAGASIVCVVSLDADHYPPHLRNLPRRLRQQVTIADLIVGLTTSASLWLGDATMPATSAAGSFRELVDTWIEAARRQLREDAPRRGVGATARFTDAAPGLTGPGRRLSR